MLNLWAPLSTFTANRTTHPPKILENIPEAINRRLSSISSDEDVFNEAAPPYQEALRKSGYTHILEFKPPPQEPSTQKRKRRRNVIWFNPPYNKNVKTNIGREFISLINRSFPTGHKLRKIFNRNTLKLSYSCMPNVKQLIDGHNKAILQNAEKEQQPRDEGKKTCNCRNRQECPLEGECLVSDVVYQATVKTKDAQETYIGLTSNHFKARYRNHQTSFRHAKRKNETELSKHVWRLKDEDEDFTLTWRIIAKAKPYTNLTKRCNLCNTEKFFLITKPHMATLNRRNELISTCRHRRKFILRYSST